MLDRPGAALAVLAFALIAGACGGSGTTDLAADATGQELSLEFGSCLSGVDDMAPSQEHLAAATAWTNVAQIVQRDSNDEESGRAKILDVSGGTAEYLVHPSYWPGIDWGLANDGEVWLARGPESSEGGSVWYAVVVTPDRRVFFPGDCSNRLLYQPLRTTYGRRLNEVIIASLGQTGPDLAETLELET